MKQVLPLLISVAGVWLFTNRLSAQDDKKKEESKEVAEARKLWDEDKAADAQKVLETRLKSNPEDTDARVLMSHVHANNGDMDKATALLEAGLKGTAADQELLWYLGQMRMRLGKDGPNVTRTGGTITYKSSGMSTEKEEEWKQKQWGLAVEAWRKFLKHDPDQTDAAENAARSLAGWKGKGHIEEIAKLKEKLSGNTSISFTYAEALVAAGRAQEALETAQQLTKSRPRSSSAWNTQAQVLMALGKKEAAADAEKRAAFYKSLPSCVPLEYSPEVVARLAAIEKNPGEEAKKLHADKSEQSNLLMAVLCWRHIAHGPVEDSCFEELTARKKGNLLCDLADEGESICTHRGCCLGLAKLKHARALEVISRYVPGDTNPIFYVNAAPALAALGDPRAVPVLVKTLAPALREKDRQRSEAESGFMGKGPLLNRIRCGFALAAFDVPEAREALTAGVKNPDIAPCCEAALYRLTKDSARLKAMEEALSKAGKDARLFRDDIVSLLKQMATSEAKDAAVRLAKSKDESKDEDPDIIEIGK